MVDSDVSAASPSVWRRLSGSLVGAAGAVVVVAALDASWAQKAQTEPASWVALFVADVGILAVAAVALAMAVGLASMVLHPRSAPTIERLRHVLAPVEPEARAFVAVLLAVSIAAAFVWTVAVAHLGLTGLVLDEASICPPSGADSASGKHCARAVAGAVGASVGLSAAVLALALAVIALGAARAIGAELVERRPNPFVFGGVALALVVVVAAYGISTGNTSGGGGTLQILGVLKRDELDLRAPGLLLLLSLGAYWAPGLTLRVPSWGAFLVLVPLLSALGHSAKGGLDGRRVALGIERGAPLGKLFLGPLRKLGDRDGDGSSSFFGGGDCDDTNNSIYPGADDMPGNGIDEDCSGQDDEEVVLEAPAVETPKNAAEWVAEKMPEKPAVLFITVDTLRWDLGFAGYRKNPISKNLDRFAKRSVVFEKAYSLASYTGKSVGPMLIGKHTSETHRGWSHFNKFRKGDTLIQERLQKAGVRTISVQGHWYFFRKEYGLGRGFDVLDDQAAPKVFQAEGDRTINSDKLTDAAIAQLEKADNVGDRFYMWVHYLDPHAEYVRHEDFDFGRSGRDRYDGEVAFTDHHVGRLIDYVSKSELGKRTIIIITSDHGEAFGEHGLHRHGFEVWEELVRVPLIVHVPGIEGRRVDVRRSAVDIVPTIASIFGLPAPTGKGADFFSGTSLLHDIVMPPGHEPRKKIVFVDMAAGPNNAERQAFIEDDLKLIATSGKPLGLYDLSKDPEEKKDLLDDEAVSKKVLPRYKAFRRKLRTVKVRKQ